MSVQDIPEPSGDHPDRRLKHHARAWRHRRIHQSVHPTHPVCESLVHVCLREHTHPHRPPPPPPPTSLTAPASRPASRPALWSAPPAPAPASRPTSRPALWSALPQPAPASRPASRPTRSRLTRSPPAATSRRPAPTRPSAPAPGSLHRCNDPPLTHTNNNNTYIVSPGAATASWPTTSAAPPNGASSTPPPSCFNATPSPPCPPAHAKHLVLSHGPHMQIHLPREHMCSHETHRRPPCSSSLPESPIALPCPPFDTRKTLIKYM